MRICGFEKNTESGFHEPLGYGVGQEGVGGQVLGVDFLLGAVGSQRELQATERLIRYVFRESPLATKALEELETIQQLVTEHGCRPGSKPQREEKCT